MTNPFTRVENKNHALSLALAVSVAYTMSDVSAALRFSRKLTMWTNESGKATELNGYLDGSLFEGLDLDELKAHADEYLATA